MAVTDGGQVEPSLTGGQVGNIAGPDRIEPSPVPSPLGVIGQAPCSRILNRGNRGEHARADALQSLAAHRGSDRLAIDRHACGGELASDPWGSVDLVGGMERVAHGLIDLGPALGSRARARLSLLAPGVVALACHAQQPGHAGDLVVRLLRVHQLEPFRPGGFDAKKAAAFPRNSLSRSRSWTRRRSCLSSSRSWPVKGVSGLGGGSRRSRSCRTQRPSSCAPTPLSSATCAIGRSVSSTSAAASRRYSGVYLFRFTIRTTLPQVSTTR